jgi:hypothetical protein
MPLAGGSLDPQDIVGRDGIVTEMHALLARGVDIVITDPRRMGKTCLLERFSYLTRAPWTTIKIDYEGVQTANEFLNRTIDGLRAHEPLRSRVTKSVGSFMENVELGAGPLKVSAAFRQRPPSELLDVAVLRIDSLVKGDERLVLALDEVPLAIENIAKRGTAISADTLLQALRRLRQQTTGIRWIVTGSVGFHHVLRLAGSTEGAINDLANIACGPLDPLWARELATMLLRGIEVEFDDETVTAMVVTSGGIPYHLHHIANTLRGLVGACTADSVVMAWDAFVHDRDQSRAFTHLLTRIRDYYGVNEASAFKILDAIARSDGPMSATCFEGDDGILDDLVDDHYLLDTPRGLVWRYPVLRDVWMIRRRLA